MHAVIVVIHVVAMIASIGLMSLAVVAGLFGKKIAALLANLGLAVTVVGGLSGTVLLLGAPLSLQCAILTAYLSAVVALHIFGFAMGDADKARLIRTR